MSDQIQSNIYFWRDKFGSNSEIRMWMWQVCICALLLHEIALLKVIYSLLIMVNIYVMTWMATVIEQTITNIIKPRPTNSQNLTNLADLQITSKHLSIQFFGTQWKHGHICWHAALAVKLHNLQLFSLLSFSVTFPNCVSYYISCFLRQRCHHNTHFLPYC